MYVHIYCMYLYTNIHIDMHVYDCIRMYLCVCVCLSAYPVWLVVCRHAPNLIPFLLSPIHLRFRQGTEEVDDATPNTAALKVLGVRLCSTTTHLPPSGGSRSKQPDFFSMNTSQNNDHSLNSFGMRATYPAEMTHSQTTEEICCV